MPDRPTPDCPSGTAPARGPETGAGRAGPGVAAARFDPAFYRAFHPDVAAAGLDPLVHYLRYGRAEGRLPYRLRALAAERDLWLGFRAWALPDLDRLAGDDDPRERAWALWAAMRWQAAEGTRAAARAALDRLWTDRAARRTLRGPGVTYLALTLLLGAGAGPEGEADGEADGGAAGEADADPGADPGADPDGGRFCGRRDARCDARRSGALLRLAARRGETADLALARMLAARTRGIEAAAAFAAHLAPCHARAGLAVPGLRSGLQPVLPSGDGAAFDRLAAPHAPPGVAWHLRRIRDRVMDRLDRGTRAAPLVSVIVPARDAAATLPTALAGLAAQGWRALEILVVDDRSTDATAAVARAWARRDRRIRLLTGPGQGAYAARNAGMAAARGDFLTVHDADDWSHPDRIAEQVGPLLADPGLAATVSHWARVDDALRPSRWPMERGEGWVHRNVSSLMIRAGLRDRLGYWDRVRAGADTEYYHRLLAALGPRALAEVRPGLPLAFGRIGEQTLTRRPDTHLRTRFLGPRRDYEEAAGRWHRRLEEGLEEAGTEPVAGARAVRWHLPRQPVRRPFAVPPALGVGDPEAVLAADDIIRRSPGFDARWYLEHNADVRADGICPALHYARSGAAQGRDPGPGFSTSGYRLAHGVDFANPLVHWETAGRAAGRAPLPDFAGALAGALGGASGGASGGAAAPRVLVCAHQAGRELFGAERSFLDMLARLAAAGEAPVAVLPHVPNPAYLDAVRARAAWVHVLPMPWWHIHRPPHAATLAGLAALIARHRVTAVHVNTAVLQAPRLAGRAAGVPVVVHLRELPAGDAAIRAAILGSAAAPGPPPPETAETIRAVLLAEADRFVANSPAAAAWLDAPGRTEVVGNRVDPGLFDLPFAPQRPLRAALISSNIAKKGIADAVAAARILAAGPTAGAGPGAAVQLSLIGPDTPDLAALGPLPGNVACPGYAESPAAALAAADVVLSLSRFPESFGRTVLEAMAAGRPAVVYDRGHPPVLVGRAGKPGAGGIVVPADDPAAVAAALAGLAADPARLAALSAAARARARAILDGTAG